MHAVARAAVRRVPRLGVMPRGARTFFDDISADIAERARTVRRARVTTVLRLLEPAELLAPETSARDEPHFARALTLLAAHAPAGGSWTAPALRAACAHAASALDDARAAAAPVAGTTLLAKMPLPPPEPDALPDFTQVAAGEEVPSLSFEGAKAALNPLARVLAVQTSLRQVELLLSPAAVESAAAADALRALTATPDALGETLGTLAFGEHSARVRTWVRLCCAARTGAGADAAADALTPEEAAVLTRALEWSARPAATELLRAIEGAISEEAELPWLPEFAAAAAGPLPPPPRRRWLAALHRRPPAERALAAHLKALALPAAAAASEPEKSDGKSAQLLIPSAELARAPPAAIATGGRLLDSAAKSLYRYIYLPLATAALKRFPPQKRTRIERRTDNRCRKLSAGRRWPARAACNFGARG
ncbi:hypothetical protein T492DRAFT_1142126 [Pavlovales sp. CCMP2436]|nr:hypothetical protein T492DRAFT_1142126 [Pavlovales sp. CCMP2436]